MAKNKFLDDFLIEKFEVTDKIVDYYKKNPDELNLIIDKEHFDYKYLSFFFVFGLFLTIISRLFAYFFKDIWGDFINDVILDVSSELGIAIFGGAVTAYLLGNLQKRQYKENVNFRNEIKKRIKKPYE